MLKSKHSQLSSKAAWSYPDPAVTISGLDMMIASFNQHKRTFFHSFFCFFLILAIGLLILAPSSFAQTTPSGPRAGGILVGDLTLNKIFLTQDLNGDGNADDPDEALVYFDETNESGLPTPTGGVFTLHQGRSGYQFIGDGDTDAVYRLCDANHDGDANDVGEATIWFSEAENAGGFTLPTPNGIFEANDGAVYIVNAGVSSRPTDAVYQTVDLNGDGDANDEDEAILWLDLSTLASQLLGVDPNRSSAFDITFIGRVAYIADTVGGESDTIFRAMDRNRNGVIDSGELTVFIDDTNEFGVPVSTGLVSSAKDLYVLESSRSAFQTVFRLTDLNKNGTIDDSMEVIEVWNEDQVPDGVELGTSFGISISHGGEIYLASAGSDTQDNIFRLVDIDSDGRFLSSGETLVWRSGNGNGILADFPRSLANVHDFLAAQDYFAVSNVYDHNDLPKDVGEIVELLCLECIDEIPDYNAIQTLYTEGKNSVKPDGSIRTIKGFADGVDAGDPENKNFKVIFPEAVAYYGEQGFLDRFLSSAIGGTGKFAEADDEQRAEAIVQGLLSTLSYWVRFEMRFSARKADDGNFACPKGAPHNWDEGFAFYYGPKGQHSLFAFADMLSYDFHLKRSINPMVIRSFRKGLKRLAPMPPAPGQTECESLIVPPRFPSRQQAEIETQLFRTFLLGILQSADNMSTTPWEFDHERAQVFQTQALGRYLAVAPQVRKSSPRADRILRKLLRKRPRWVTGVLIKNVIKLHFHDVLDLPK